MRYGGSYSTWTFESVFSCNRIHFHQFLNTLSVLFQSFVRNKRCYELHHFSDDDTLGNMCMRSYVFNRNGKLDCFLRTLNWNWLCPFSVLGNGSRLWFADALTSRQCRDNLFVHLFLHGSRVSFANNCSKWWDLCGKTVSISKPYPTVHPAHDSTFATTILSRRICYYESELGEFRSCEQMIAE